MGSTMQLRKGMRVKELTKRVGQVPRMGKVRDLHGHSVEVEWDDGHISSVTGSYLFPADKPTKKSD